MRSQNGLTIKNHIFSTFNMIHIIDLFNISVICINNSVVCLHFNCCAQGLSNYSIWQQMPKKNSEVMFFSLCKLKLELKPRKFLAYKSTSQYLHDALSSFIRKYRNLIDHCRGIICCNSLAQ